MKIETPRNPYDRETVKKEQEKIKADNVQLIINILKAQGIDDTKIPRHEFDGLLRIMKKDSELQQSHNKLMMQFSEIVAPYKIITVVSPDISDEMPLEPETKETE